MTGQTTAVPAVPDEPAPFDPCEPVAEGITLLEASAGTGKTHAVTSLVVREVADGRRLDELLVVTFTRKATGTLRERVWRRLTEAARFLTPGATGPSEPIDPLLDHLRSGSPDDVTTRRRRLERALSDFDAATIATTHGFCQHVLSGLGVAGDAERDLVLVDDLGALVPDAVDDLFIRRFHAGGDVPFPHHAARQMARTIIANPDCELADVAANDTDRLRRRFARTLRERIVEQKRRARIITYDDLLARLADSLADPERGANVAERLRRRFTMAIVDEFQDTDSVQWRILRTAFGAAPSRLVLVGDPKQAIYAFRGGDVFAYLQATRDAGRRRGLPVSWRADQPLLDAIDAIFAGAQLGDPAIRHRPLRARPGADASALGGAAPDAPLSVRIADRNPDDFALTPGGWAVKASVRRFIATDLADYTARLLQAGTTIEGRAVGAGDLAVLTRTRNEAEAIATALLGAGVPAVVHGASSVLRTKAARHWLDLLRALERPSAETRVNAVAIGPFVGWDAGRLALATDHDREDLDTALHDWAAAMRTRSVGGLFRLIETTGDLASRLSGRVGGDRMLADLRHVAELLHHHQMAIPGSVAGLIRWLAEQIAEADQVGSDSARRRLESDADAVAVHTIHSAKGLEFPIVFLPSAWEAPPETRDNTIPVFHGDDGGRRIGVGGPGPVRHAQVVRAEQERDDEDLRLLYVALTRARHQVVLWWASGYDADRSAFARVLLGRDDDGVVTRSLSPPPEEATIADALRALGIPVRRAGTTGTRYRPPEEPAAGLAVRAFERQFDRHWARTSYTGLTRAAHQAGAASAAPGESDDDATPDAAADGAGATDPLEVDEGAKVDEPSVSPAPGPPDGNGALGAVLPLGGLPGGARIGTLVHHVLERTDFAAADLPTELARAVTAAGARRVLDGDADVLAAGLALALDTPLGPGLGGIRLRDVHRADRLDELAFDLPLAGGDAPGPALVTMGALAATFARLPAGEPMAGYHERLDDPLLATAVRGFLTGSIDLVARLGGRYLVVDYKTNHLAPHGEDPVAWHYRPAALTEAMMAAHYPLQAAFYAVALHRFLRWRLSGYRPDGHLAGVAYLFLRGMTGVDTPTVGGAPCGVFTWTPPIWFVLELSDVLDRGVLDGGPT